MIIPFLERHDFCYNYKRETIMRFLGRIVLVCALIAAGCGGYIQITPTPTPPAHTLVPPTLEQIRTALGENNQFGMVPNFGLGEITIPPCTQADGSAVDFPITYSMSDVPAWLAFDEETRAVSLNGFSVVPPAANTAAEVSYTCTDDTYPEVNASQTFVINDLDGGGIVDGKEYEFGEVPLVGLAGYFQLNRDDVDLYRPGTNAFVVPTGVVRATVGLNPTDAADDTEDFDGDEGVTGGGNNSEEVLDSTNIFAHQSAGTFTSSVNSYGARDDPRSIVSADFDGDGDLDLAVTNWGFSDNVSVFINNGDGTFANDVIYVTGNDPYGIGAADMDGDGDIDLVTANSSFTLSVLPGNGDGTFANNENHAASDRLSGLALADLDGDGDIDAVAANISTNRIAVFLNRGDATFDPEVTYTAGVAGDAPEHVTAADFDGDGDMDVAATNRIIGGGLFVLPGNGDGTFGSYSTYGTESFPYGVSSADFDYDGNLDLAVANAGSNNVSVLLGNGDGTFGTDNTYAVGTQPRGVVASDLNGDGYIDLATANWTSGDTSVLLGRGDGSFDPFDAYATDGGSFFLVSADFNVDGELDLAVVNSATDNMTVLLND